MLRLPHFTALVYLISQQLGWSYDRIDPTDLLNHGCLVHASSVAPDNNIKYAGSLRGAKVIPFEKAARGRITLHHCLSSLVPNIAMGGVIYISGMAISSSLQQGQGHNQSPYIFLTPIRKIVDRIYGGSLNDLFVIDQLEYDGDTTVFIDNGHIAIFKNKNPDFKGKVILFDAAQDNVRELVDQEIKAQGYWSTTFSQFKEGAFQEVTLNGTPYYR